MSLSVTVMTDAQFQSSKVVRNQSLAEVQERKTSVYMSKNTENPSRINGNLT